ncbi:hypothetical protein C2845_PM08G07510 [Panicum miliaceum]|uniref:Uncharacterized protein n=1 Tax=Panicum miliaceum TaxID=4540 RepID=A0A3L6R1E1_PANMI|nr:hypothetical protein C2845_PM08G07510 [Panicum miliaceum]
MTVVKPSESGLADFNTPSDYASLDMQLAQYFKKSASGIIVPVLFGFLPLSSCNGTKAAIAFSVFAVLSLLFTVVPLLFAGKMQKQPAGDSRTNTTDAQRRQFDNHKRRIEMLCYAAYASNILLMCTAVCLAAVVNKKYSALASPLLLVFFVMFAIFIECGHRNKFTWGALEYESQQSDLKFFFDLSSEVAQNALTGLSGSLLGSMKNAGCLQGNSFRTTEGFILYAVVVGLFLMLVCTIPPALEFSSTREKVVNRFLKWTAYFSLALISLAGLFAAATVVQTYVVFATVLIVAVGAFWFYMVHCSEPSENVPLCWPDAKGRHAAGERSLMWLGIHSVMFGTLMASYSAVLSGQRLSALYKAGVFFIFAVLLTNFSRMVLVREVQDKGNEAWVVNVTGIAMVVLMLLAVLLLILLAMLQPEQLRSTFKVA